MGSAAVQFDDQLVPLVADILVGGDVPHDDLPLPDPGCQLCLQGRACSSRH